MFRKVFLVIALFVIGFETSLAQKVDNIFPPVPKAVIDKPYCEFNVPKLEELGKIIGSTKFLIIVSHLSTAERTSLASRRLFNAKGFFTTPPFSRSPDSILIAEGEKVTGLGYVDFFVDNDLQLRIFLNKNAELVVTACVVDPPGSRCTSLREKKFFPCKK
ncbi:MAG: hypothetical protein ACKVQJ_03685 [Pyrinomonadaceae bacterium]